MMQITLMFEGPDLSNEEIVAGELQSAVFEIMEKNAMTVRHFNRGQTIGSVTAVKPAPSEVMVPEFMSVYKYKDLMEGKKA